MAYRLCSSAGSPLSSRRPCLYLASNLLDVREAPELVAPAPVAGPEAGVRFQLTVNVEDVDLAVAELQRRGAPLLNGPMNRSWGIRTASFRDPGGHVWEVAS